MGVLATTAAAPVRDLRSSQLTDVRASLEASLSQDADALPALNDLAVTYALEERFDAARQLLEDVVARGGPREQQSALVNLAELYGLEGYLSAAAGYLATARAIDPTRSAPAYALALLADARNDGSVADALRAAVAADPSGDGRAELVFLYPEERLHLGALVAELAGDRAAASTAWRELSRGRFPILALTAQRHLDAAPAP